MADKFNEAFEVVIGHEGKFQNLNWDRGNWTSGTVGVGQNKGTKFGITAMTYPDLDIINLTVEDAKKLYKRDFWDKFYKPDMSAPIQLVLLDTAINSGVGKAKELYARSGDDVYLFLDYREAYLRQLGSSPKYSNALRGWLNRINSLRAQVEQWKLIYPTLPDDSGAVTPTVLLDTGAGFKPITGRYEDGRVVVNTVDDKVYVRVK